MANVSRKVLRVDSDTEPTPPIKVLIVYESFQRGLRASQIYDRLTRNLDREFVIEVDVWKFDVLEIPSLGKLAAAQATRADLVLIAIDGRNPLPGAFQLWLETWIEAKAGQDSALVLLSNPSGDGLARSASIRVYLREMAARGSMTFISDSMTALAPSMAEENVPPRSRPSVTQNEGFLARALS